MRRSLILSAMMVVLSSCADDGPAVDAEAMSFFATSEGSGASGGDLGGLAGADATCQRLAEKAGSSKSWRAYLCTSEVDARDRIGNGPWENALGELVAADLTSLHERGISNDDPQLILTEKGRAVPSKEHDILTGCKADGTLYLLSQTCTDWSSSSPTLQSYVGHTEIPEPPFDNLTSWNAAHTSACDEDGLIRNRGTGRLYCFAVE